MTADPAPETPSSTLRQKLILCGALLAVVGTFLLDINTPRGVAAGPTPYYFAIILAVVSRPSWAAITIAALAAIGTITGYLLTEGGNPTIVLSNRILIVVALALFAFVGGSLVRA
jgi:hypothetical protein